LIGSIYLTKSWKVAALIAITGLFASLLTFSLMGYLGIAQNPVNVLAINLFIPLGAAFAIHAHGYVKRGGEKMFGWLPKSSLGPFGFATFTTMIGFGSTALSRIPAVQQFGLLGVFGIAICLLVTFTLTMPILSAMNISESGHARKQNKKNWVSISMGYFMFTCLRP